MVFRVPGPDTRPSAPRACPPVGPAESGTCVRTPPLRSRSRRFRSGIRGPNRGRTRRSPHPCREETLQEKQAEDELLELRGIHLATQDVGGLEEEVLELGKGDFVAGHGDGSNGGKGARRSGSIERLLGYLRNQLLQRQEGRTAGFKWRLA